MGHNGYGRRSVPDLKCFICGDSFTYLLTHYDSLYRTSDKEYEVYKCAGCGLFKIIPEPTSAELTAFYPDEYYSFNTVAGSRGVTTLIVERVKQEVLDLHYGGEGKSAALRPLAHLARNYMARNSLAGIPLRRPRHNGRFLDIGCGDGYWVRKLGQYGWDCTGVDFVGEENENIRIGDFLDMDFSGRFEYIRLSHVLEHVPDPEKYLARIRSILSREGECYIETPNTNSPYCKTFGKYWFDLDVPRHLHCFNERNLGMLLQRNGLVIKSLRYISRYSLGNCVRNYLRIKKGYEIKDDLLVIGLALSPIDACMNFFGPGNNLSVVASISEA